MDRHSRTTYKKRGGMAVVLVVYLNQGGIEIEATGNLLTAPSD
jgi:hypothetical protein